MKPEYKNPAENRPFIDDHFLLQSPAAIRLYEAYAAGQPIIDYHCHLNPKDIAENRQFANLTDAWLKGDHYKWRAMRTNGVPEEYITGNKPDEEKFLQWAETVPKTLRNPLYHWTHLELNRYFGIPELLNPASAGTIYEDASEKLRQPGYSVQQLLLKMNVKVVCTTDDPLDSLEYHQHVKEHPFGVAVIPAWRPDKAMSPENITTYNQYLDQLSDLTGMEISRFDDLIAALKIRHNYFHTHGCRLSDHGLERVYARECPESEIRIIFGKIRNRIEPDRRDISHFKSAMLYHLALMDHEKGWVQQFHIGAMRNNNSRMFDQIGPDTGYDSIGKPTNPYVLSRFLNRLSREEKLAKTILYNLHPADNAMFATMTGNFQGGGEPGKIQWGAAWWFLDQKQGMEDHLNTLSSLGLLSRFVGMLTDSRSFLSFPRHEYFRRILCNLLGRDMENGEMPYDFELVGGMVSDICYNNANNYFPFEL
jgi:glucuronate isomerase